MTSSRFYSEITVPKYFYAPWELYYDSARRHQLESVFNGAVARSLDQIGVIVTAILSGGSGEHYGYRVVQDSREIIRVEYTTWDRTKAILWICNALDRLWLRGYSIRDTVPAITSESSQSRQ